MPDVILRERGGALGPFDVQAFTAPAPADDVRLHTRDNSLGPYDVQLRPSLPAIAAASTLTVSTVSTTFTNHPNCTECCEGCECPCCVEGYWDEFTITIADIVPALFGTACAGYNGTFVLKYRGMRAQGAGEVCVWSTDERAIDDGSCEGDVVLHPFDDSPEKWILYCEDGLWVLINAGTTVAWAFNADDFPEEDFCVDGGDMLYVFADTSACCRWDGRAVFPTESNYLTVTPSGTFYPC